ncbi:MAG: hypothetical protein ACR652_14645 [Methylocystis sp.]|uniref:hypothetical protein n=1 Tax=Methylocystis sp. TaxID=1911079 RepID=UPI003DA492BC
MASTAATSEFVEYVMQRKWGVTRASYENWRGNPLRYRFHGRQALAHHTAGYRSVLERMSPTELQKTVGQIVKNKAPEQRPKDAFEDPMLFNALDATADYHHWSKMEFWTLDEATALSLDKEPETVTFESLRESDERAPFARDYLKRRNLLMRVQEAGVLNFPVVPSDFVNWSEAKELQLPEELTKLVHKTAGSVEDRKRLIAERDALLAEVDQLKRKGAHKRASDLTHRLNTLQKIFLGMTIRGYAYNPYASGNKVSKEIEGDLESLGIRVTYDTITKHLKNAREDVELHPEAEAELKAMLI